MNIEQLLMFVFFFVIGHFYVKKEILQRLIGNMALTKHHNPATELQIAEKPNCIQISRYKQIYHWQITNIG